jgi:uncharacterized protein
MTLSRLKRVFKIMIITTVTLGVIGIIAIEEFALPYMPISPMKRTSDLTPDTYGMRSDMLTVAVEKDLILRGYFLYANTATPKATIIMVHGIGGFKEGFLGYSKILVDNGYNVILYDQRGHGKSDGKYCTFGFYEKYDISKFIDIAEGKYPNMPVGIHGSSLGGAVALQALAIEKRLRFGIVESTFHRLEDIVMEYGLDYFKFKSRWLAQRVLSKSAAIANYKPFDIKPIEAAAQIEQPMLLIHGDKDTKIPIAFNQENFAALKSRDKEFYTVHGAGHLDVGSVGGTVYLSKVISFFDKHCEH